MKKIFIVIFVLALLLTGCTGSEGNYIETTDREGNTVRIPKTLNSIVSTVPSNTEILVGLGLGSKIVAVDNYGIGVEGLPDGVNTLDLDNPDMELLLSLKPDVIIASEFNRQGGADPFAALRDAGTAVLYLPTSQTIEGIYGDIAYLAEVTDTKAEGERLIEEMKAEVERVRTQWQVISSLVPKSVYFEIDMSPSLYSFGKDTFMNELLETAGGVNIFAGETGWIAASPESIVSLNPDVIISTVTWVDDVKSEIENRTGFSSISAVKNGEIYVINPDLVSRPSQNCVRGLNEIAKILYPQFYEE